MLRLLLLLHLLLDAQRLAHRYHALYRTPLPFHSWRKRPAPLSTSPCTPFSASAFISSTVASTTLHTPSPHPRGSSAYRGTSWKSAESCSSITSYSAHTMGDDGLICASALPRAPT